MKEYTSAQKTSPQKKEYHYKKRFQLNKIQSIGYLQKAFDFEAQSPMRDMKMDMQPQVSTHPLDPPKCPTIPLTLQQQKH